MEYVGAISSAVMALVWVVYFHLFFRQYQHNNRPYLVIHHAQNERLDSHCLLVNMGKEPVHIQCVQAGIYNGEGLDQVMTVTEYERVNAENQNIQHLLRQGPLQPGGYLVLGTFRDIIRGHQSDTEDASLALGSVEGLELRVAVVHGPSKYPIGARRNFFLEHKGGTRIYPQNIHTEQLTRRRDRNTIRTWLEAELNPRNVGRTESDTSDQSEEQRGELERKA